jgi:hypothetical protein
MLILPDFQKPYIIDGYNSPILPKWFWTFSASMFDFTLSPITFIEENCGAVIKLEINGLEFHVPYNWYIMVGDYETSQLDWLPIQECAIAENQAFLMSPSDNITRLASIKILDVIENYYSYYPILQKTNALCHPVSKDISKGGIEVPLCCVIGPNDLYKYISGQLIGDFF